jgi:hypothetical protein
MPRTSIAKYLAPWAFKHAKEQQRLEQLRGRNGDNCWRCRRPLRFDLPGGHDQAPTIQSFADGTDSLDSFCLTHRRCVTEAQDHTAQVEERLRLKREAELLARSRKRRKAA